MRLPQLSNPQWALLGIVATVVVAVVGGVLNQVSRRREGASKLAPHLALRPLVFLQPTEHDRPRPFAFGEIIVNTGSGTASPVFIWCEDPFEDYAAELIRLTAIRPDEEVRAAAGVYRREDGSDLTQAEARAFFARATIEVWGWDQRRRTYRFTTAGGGRVRRGRMTPEQVMAAIYHFGRSTDPGKSLGWLPPDVHEDSQEED